MYQISRSIYRELEADIIEDRLHADGPTNHERVLHACEAAVHRLTTDRHYFARPSRTLFNDIRAFFPMSAQLHVYRVVDRYLTFAAEYLADPPDRGARADRPEAGLPRDDAQGHAVPADAAAAQRLLPLAPAPRRDRGDPRRRVDSPPMLLGVDVGGTFTDAVVAAGGRLVTAKAPTTPEDQSEGVLAAVEAALEKAGADAEEVEAFAHGTTVATNALLEGNGARTVLVATSGFEDVVELGRQARADLYRLCAAHPAPLVPPEPARRRAGADDARRAAATPLADPAALAREIAGLDPEAVAVCLLHAYRHPEHEQALGAALAEQLPDVHVSLSHEVVGTFREYERAATTEIDAALSPLLSAYLRSLAERAADAGLPAPDVMQSSGGLASLDQARAHAALTVLSGPAGGAAGAAWAALAADEPDALCFDMGGTSCDVCVIEDGSARETGRPAGRRPPDRAADARPAHRRRRRRLDRLARRGRRAARRPALGRRTPGTGRATATAARSRP